jgi:ureidoacrylate peracid hydrolase
MHKIAIPQHVIDRVVRRQGKLHAHDDVPVAKTALVVIDLQNYFMVPGQQAEIPLSREIVPNVNRLAGVLRERGGTVVWIRTMFTEETLTSISHFHEVLMTPERQARRAAALAEGAFGAELYSALDVRPEDLIVKKTRYSAFIQGASDLEALLRQRGITAVLIAGTTTETCCESTARDAMMLNFRTTMISDGTAAVNDAEHNGSLINFCLNFGDVASTEELVKRFQGTGAAKQPALADAAR